MCTKNAHSVLEPARLVIVLMRFKSGPGYQFEITTKLIQPLSLSICVGWK